MRNFVFVLSFIIFFTWAGTAMTQYSNAAERVAMSVEVKVLQSHWSILDTLVRPRVFITNSSSHQAVSLVVNGENISVDPKGERELPGVKPGDVLTIGVRVPVLFNLEVPLSEKVVQGRVQ